LTGAEEDLTAALAALALPAGAEVLGPVPVPAAPVRGPDAAEPAPLRAVIRVPRTAGAALSRTLVEMQGVRAARKLPPVRVRVDPVELE
jgi:primosomal protein N' (replication factor Y)